MRESKWKKNYALNFRVAISTLCLKFSISSHLISSHQYSIIFHGFWPDQTEIQAKGFKIGQFSNLLVIIMSSEPFPVTELAKRLESCDDSEFIAILKCLRSPAYVNEQLLKSELGLLVTKTLALLRSSHEIAIWRGCQTAVVICTYNPLVLCAHAGQLLAAIYSKLEQKVDYYSSSTPQTKVLLQTLVFALSSLMNLMRGKPSLSREGLVPKLKAIIPTLITLAQYEPRLTLPTLKILLYKNTTTFRPFANKFRVVLVNLITSEYEHFDKKTKQLLSDNFAYLHLIKLQGSAAEDEAQAHHKSYQDDNWRIGIFSVLSQFKPILDICGEILDLEQDKELQKLINSLTFTNNTKGSEASDFLSGLKLDMNSPMTLLEITRRLNLLVDLLSSFLSLPTPYPVRIPLGTCISISEALLSMTRNFLPLRRDVRGDAELSSVIRDLLPQIQFSGIKLLSSISQTYGKLCLSMLPSILGSLELFIPLQQKSSKIDLDRCASLKSEMIGLFNLVNSFLPHMGHHMQEVDFFTKLVEVALHLTKDASTVDLVFNQQATNTLNNRKNLKKKQKKDNSSGSLSDLYTHPEKFKLESSDRLLCEVNHFLRGIISTWKVPSSQQLRILKYTISTAVQFKQQQGFIPKSLLELLRTEVLYPGDERVSILPLAVSLLKESSDEVFDILCHPRLPLSVIHHVKPLPEYVEESFEDEEEEEEEKKDLVEEDTVAAAVSESLSHSAQEQAITTSFKSKQVVIEELTAVEPTRTTDIQEEPENDIIFKKREREEETTAPEELKRSKIISEATVTVEKQPIVTESKKVQVPATEENGASSDDDSEFEIPNIHLSDDEDDEDDSEE